MHIEMKTTIGFGICERGIDLMNIKLSWQRRKSTRHKNIVRINGIKIQTKYELYIIKWTLQADDINDKYDLPVFVLLLFVLPKLSFFNSVRCITNIIIISFVWTSNSQTEKKNNFLHARDWRWRPFYAIS